MKRHNKRNRFRWLLWFAAASTVFAFARCAAVGPNYTRPEVSVHDSWNNKLEGSRTASIAEHQDLARWWKALNDPQLNGLIDRAVKGNLDVKQAKARVREARARRGISRASLYPTLDAQASAARSQYATTSGPNETNTQYLASFDAGWELDLFGGVRRSVEASTADLQAQEEDLRDVLVSLLAEVALNYVDVRTYQARLAVTEANLESQAKTHQLTVWRNEAGLSDRLAVEQARYDLENTRAQVPSLQTGLEGAMNRIAILLGEQPGAVHAELAQRRPIPVAPADIYVGVPADVLLRRPDVRKAERQLAAQTARIGVATAELYPKINLSASTGLGSLTLGNLFSSGNGTSSGSAVISLPIFRGGSIRKNIEVQSALQEQYLYAYESTVNGALEEVENALTAFAKEEERRRSLDDAAQAAKNASDLVLREYQAGLIDFSNVLITQRSLLTAQDQLAGTEGAVTADLIRLYKALGGGWTDLDREHQQNS